MLKMPGIDEFREQCLDWLRQHWAGDLTQAEQAFNQAACGAVAAPMHRHGSFCWPLPWMPLESGSPRRRQTGQLTSLRP